MYSYVYTHLYIHPKVNKKFDTENSSPHFRDLSSKGREAWGFDPPAPSSHWRKAALGA